MNIKMARETKGIKRRDLALACGVHYSHIHKVEAAVHGASPDLARKLEAILSPYTNRIEIMWPEDYRTILEAAARLLECPPEDLHTILSAAGCAANGLIEPDNRQPGK